MVEDATASADPSAREIRRRAHGRGPQVRHLGGPTESGNRLEVTREPPRSTWTRQPRAYSRTGPPTTDPVGSKPPSKLMRSAAVVPLRFKEHFHREEPHHEYRVLADHFGGSG